MESARSTFVEVRTPTAREASLNLGLLVALGLCLAFWALAALSLTLIL
jgi:hypothetical protein